MEYDGSFCMSVSDKLFLKNAYLYMMSKQEEDVRGLDDTAVCISH